MKYLENIDWHATDRCNLRCTSCGHFCALVNNKTTETDRTPEQAQKDFESLYNATDNGKYVKKLTITGGECTLNKDLSEIIEIAEKYFPSKVILWTNARNRFNLSQELINTIKKYNISLNITVYELSVFNKYKEDILDKYNIPYTAFSKQWNNTDYAEFFDKFFTKDKIEINNITKYCYSKYNCGQLVDQKLYVCQYGAFIKYLFNKFPSLEQILEYNKDTCYIDLTKVNDYSEIENFIDEYNDPICEHCIDKWMNIPEEGIDKLYTRIKPWELSKQNLDEWVCDNISFFYDKINKNE
jgi:organic radical activating enzyme